MKEIWQTAISPGVLPVSILLACVALYWTMSLIGLADFDSLGGGDGGGDAGGDAGGGEDGDSDGDGDGVLGNVTSAMLRIVNAEHVPLMAVLSVLVIMFWTSSMVGSLLFRSNSGLVQSLVALGAFAAALALTRVVLTPLRPFFKAMQQDIDNHLPVVGRSGRVKSFDVTETYGQVEVTDPNTPLLINARVKPGSEPLVRGDEVIIFEKNSEKNIYFVKKLSDQPAIPNI